jgi:tetratricopeptide (TPR) repeat protein
MRSTAVVLGALCLLASVARADDATEAKAHYQKGTSHFAIGEFSLAAGEYEEAYKLKPDAALLFNAAQARRLAGENEKALVLYKNYTNLYPRARNISEVKDQIAKLEQAIASAQTAKTSPPTGTVEPKPEPPPVATPPPTTTPPPANANENANVERTPVYKKWWLWTIVGVVVVAAVVIPVAVIEGSSKWTNVSDQGPGAALTVRW